MIKCKVCGAVGNWPEFIESGACHKKNEATKYELIMQLARILPPDVFQLVKSCGFFTKPVLVGLIAYWDAQNGR